MLPTRRVFSATEFARITATKEREFQIVYVRGVSTSPSAAYICLRNHDASYSWVKFAEGSTS